MVFRFNEDEVNLIRAALTQERGRIVRDIAGLHHFGPCDRAMQLCERRSSVESLLERLDRGGDEPLKIVANPKFAFDPGLKAA